MQNNINDLVSLEKNFLYEKEKTDLSFISSDVDMLENLEELSEKLDDFNVANLASLAVLLSSSNDYASGLMNEHFDKALVYIDSLIDVQVNGVKDTPLFKELKSNWLQIQDINSEQYQNTGITLIDVCKEELQSSLYDDRYDLKLNDLYKTIYIQEYGTYGGEPYGAWLGLYDFTNTDDDISSLISIGNIAKNAHCPFFANVSNDILGSNINDLQDIVDLENHFNHPKYNNWNQMRELDSASYVSLSIGRYILELPKDPVNNPSSGLMSNFCDSVDYLDSSNFLYGLSSVKMIKNICSSFVNTGWFQFMRGPKSGGLVKNLLYPKVVHDNYEEIRPSVDILIPDYLEYGLSRVGINGFTVNKQSYDQAAFFSINSIRRVIDDYEDNYDSANSALVANVGYVLCVSKIAHYIKCAIREEIGSLVSKDEIAKIIKDWLSRYTNISSFPSEYEKKKFPFKHTSFEINNIPGKLGWYSTKISILPHIQFEGLDAELKLESKLDPSLFIEADSNQE